MTWEGTAPPWASVSLSKQLISLGSSLKCFSNFKIPGFLPWSLNSQGKRIIGKEGTDAVDAIGPDLIPCCDPKSCFRVERGHVDGGREHHVVRALPLTYHTLRLITGWASS